MRAFLLGAMLCASVSGCVSTSKSVTSPAFFDGYNAIKRADYASAERFLTTALSTNPNDPYANLAMGSVLYQTGRPDKARTFYQSAIDHGGNTFGSRSFMTRGTERPMTAGATKSIADLARQNLALIN